MPRFGRVVLGGTFDRLHRGHEALLATAFRLGRTVAIGLTSDVFLARHRKPQAGRIRSATVRRRSLATWLARRYPRARWTIVPIDDRFGGAVGEGVDALVVSADTVTGGRDVNRERLRRGRRAVPLVVVPLVLADDLEPLSSRRIRAGEVDRLGRRRGPLTVGLVTTASVDRGAAVRAVRRAFPPARVLTVNGSARPRSSPAVVRRLASRARGGRALGVAVGRRGRAGWLVAVEGRYVKLKPFRLSGTTPRALETGLAHRLRPSRPKRL